LSDVQRLTEKLRLSYGPRLTEKPKLSDGPRLTEKLWLTEVSVVDRETEFATGGPWPKETLRLTKKPEW